MQHIHQIDRRVTGGFNLWSKLGTGRRTYLGSYSTLRQAKTTARLLAGWRGKVEVIR